MVSHTGLRAFLKLENDIPEDKICGAGLNGPQTLVVLSAKRCAVTQNPRSALPLVCETCGRWKVKKRKTPRKVTVLGKRPEKEHMREGLSLGCIAVVREASVPDGVS